MTFFEFLRRKYVENRVRSDILFPNFLNRNDLFITTDSKGFFAPKAHEDWDIYFHEITQLLTNSFGEKNSLKRSLIEGSEKRSNLITSVFSFDVTQPVIRGEEFYFSIASPNYFLKIANDLGYDIYIAEEEIPDLYYQIGSLHIIKKAKGKYEFKSSLEKPKKLELKVLEE